MISKNFRCNLDPESITSLLQDINLLCISSLLVCIDHYIDIRWKIQRTIQLRVYSPYFPTDVCSYEWPGVCSSEPHTLARWTSNWSGAGRCGGDRWHIESVAREHPRSVRLGHQPVAVWHNTHHQPRRV